MTADTKQSQFAPASEGSTTPPDQGAPPPDHTHGGPIVTITVNGATVEIHRGRQEVVTIKRAGSVPIAHDLEQVIDGSLRPLPDDGSVTLKGEEVFVSHPKDAGSA